MKKNINIIFKDNKKLFLIILVFSFIYGIGNVFVPIFIGNGLNNIVNNNILSIILILFFSYIILFLSEIFASISLNKISSSLSKKLRHNIFKKINTIKISYIDDMQIGDILNLINVDIENIVRVVNQTSFKILSGIVTILGITIVIININLILAIILIISAPIMFIISKFIVNRTNIYFIRRADKISDLNEYSEEIISKYKSIKNYMYEKEAIQKFEQINNNLYNISLKAQFFSALTNPSSRFVINIIYILIGITGAILAQKNIISVGEISTFLIYVNIYTRPFNEITSYITEIQTGIVSINRIKAILDKEDESNIENNNMIKLKKCIEFKNVEFSYKNNKKFIENLNFVVNKNEKIAIVGKTGSGKTTLINLLMKFYNINNGSIMIDGVDIENIPNKILRKNIGVVLQDSKLFFGTIKENISYGNEIIDESDIRNLEEKMNLDSFINRLYNGYDTIIENENMLSIGEIQLINIARLLLLKPQIVILDEATSDLDIVTEKKIQNAIKEITENATSFIIAHRLSTIKNADKILYMEDGNIIEQGSHEELMRKKGKYFELYSYYNTK